VPLALLTVTNDKVNIDGSVVLDTREKTLAIDTSKPFKLNAGTYGVCESIFFSWWRLYSWMITDRVLYSDERFAAIANEAAKGDAVFSLNDRIGLVHDIMALSKAGFCKVSSALTIVDILHDEQECECPILQLATSLVNLLNIISSSPCMGQYCSEHRHSGVNLVGA